MNGYLVHLVKYNQSANNQVIKLLTELGESERILDRKSYYKSMHGLLEHITGGAIYFQKFIKASYPEINGLNHKYMKYEIEPGNTGDPGFLELENALSELDSAFVKMVESLTDEDLGKDVVLTLPQAKLKYPLAVFIMMYINHGTHHRGQISQILDEMGIDNNFGIIAPQYE